jgi:hypothetical protein
MNQIKSIIRVVIAAYFFMSYSSASHAIDSPDLIINCQELVAIYNKKAEKRLLAGISTSVAEAMRAGICKGMIEEHLNHKYCGNTWYTTAKNIAASTEESMDVSTDELIDSACHG